MKFNSAKRIPQSISPCPLIQAVIEVRFETSLDEDVILGLVFSKLGSEFPNLEKLPASEIPKFVRDSDPNLFNAPLFTLGKDNLKILIGSRSLSIVCEKEYIGWKPFYQVISSILTKVKEISLIDNTTRIAARYISFFENANIFEKIDAKVELSDNPLSDAKNFIRTEFEHDDAICVLQLNNNSIYQETPEKPLVSGSTIDIDVIYNVKNKLNDNECMDIIEKVHSIEKILFFNLITDEYLKEFNPVY